MSRAQENSVVRRLSGQALAAAAKSALPAQEWPDFFPWLHDASKSSDAVHRELALMAFASLMAYLGTLLLCTSLFWTVLSQSMSWLAHSPC